MRDNRPRVLHVITSLDEGGAQGMLYRLCAADRGRVHHSVVSLMSPGIYGPRLEALGVHVHALGLKRKRVSVLAILRLARIVRGSRPSAVQTWLYHADLLGGAVARLCRVPRVAWNVRHANLRPGETKRSTILIARLCAMLSQLIPDVIVCCAEEAFRVHRELGYDAQRMVVIGNGFEFAPTTVDQSLAMSVRKRWGVTDSSDAVIGTVARWDILKDHHNLFGALALLKGAGVTPICVLAGSGMTHDNADLMSTAGDYGVVSQLRLLGHVSDVGTMMQSLDVHVLSSMSEAFPNVLVEAMAVGTPCIATDVGESRKIIGDTGWIVTPRDPNALAAAIAQALAAKGADPEAWNAQQARSRGRVERLFHMDRVVSRYHREVWQVGAV